MGSTVFKQIQVTFDLVNVITSCVYFSEMLGNIKKKFLHFSSIQPTKWCRSEASILLCKNSLVIRTIYHQLVLVKMACIGIVARAVTTICSHVALLPVINTFGGYSVCACVQKINENACFTHTSQT